MVVLTEADVIADLPTLVTVPPIVELMAFEDAVPIEVAGEENEGNATDNDGNDLAGDAMYAL